MTADDYFAIQNLIYRYCERIDRADFIGIGELFAHAAIHVPALPEPVRGAAAVTAMYTQFTRVYPETGTPRTRHVTSNVIIEPDGAQTRRVPGPMCSCIRRPRRCRCSRSSAGATRIASPRWTGTWRFTERRMDMDLFGNLSAHLLQQFGP